MIGSSGISGLVGFVVVVVVVFVVVVIIGELRLLCFGGFSIGSAEFGWDLRLFGRRTFFPIGLNFNFERSIFVVF